MSRRSDLRKLQAQVEEAEKQELLQRLEASKPAKPAKNSFESFMDAVGCLFMIFGTIIAVGFIFIWIIITGG